MTQTKTTQTKTTQTKTTQTKATQTKTWRQQQAEATRVQIMSSARRLFSTRGYTATTVDAIAKDSGVAVQTVFKAFGSKRSIAHELNELIDREAKVLSFATRAAASDDPVELITLTVQLRRSLHERCGDIIAAIYLAGSAEPELAAVAAEGTRRHVEGVRHTAARLQELGVLRPDIDVEHAAGLLDQLCSPAAFDTLVNQHGWTDQQCEDRLIAAATRLLLVDG